MSKTHVLFAAIGHFALTAFMAFILIREQLRLTREGKYNLGVIMAIPMAVGAPLAIGGLCLMAYLGVMP